jgi:hypothetical protein
MKKFTKTKKLLGAACFLLAISALNTNVVFAINPNAIWQTVVDNEAEFDTVQANWSRTTEVWEGATKNLEVTASGTVKIKKSASVPGAMLKRMTTSTQSINSNYNTYRPSNGKTYIEYPAIEYVYYRDAQIGDLTSDAVMDTGNLTYVGTDTIETTAVKVIDAPYPQDCPLLKARMYIDDTTGVVLRTEYIADDSSTAKLYEVDPDDVTQTGNGYYPTAATTTIYDPADNGENVIHYDSFSSFTINATIADSVFDYTIPGGWTSEKRD